MIFKAIVVAVLLFILYTLGTGLFYLVKDKSGSERTVKALTIRIAFSVGLFILLLIGMATGLIAPHGVTPG